jgi:hypothetical protein
VNLDTFKDKCSYTVHCILNGPSVLLFHFSFKVIDYRNLKLLNQFLSDYNGELLSSQRTGKLTVSDNPPQTIRRIDINDNPPTFIKFFGKKVLRYNSFFRNVEDCLVGGSSVGGLT